MTTLGRNQPCHCGSGRKYKKCCLRKDEDLRHDEQDRQAIEYALAKGLVDPFAGDEDWQEEPDPEQHGNFVDVDWGDEPQFDDWYDDDAEDGLDMISDYLPYKEKEHLSKAEIDCMDNWWDIFQGMEEPQELAAHISRFMDEHPLLVNDLGLEIEPMFRLELSCGDQGGYQSCFDLVSRLRSEFPEAYQAGFARYDRLMVHWLLIVGRKQHIPEYLENFRRYPNESPEDLAEVINILASSNCLDILEDFLPLVFQQLKDMPIGMVSEDILHPTITLIFAPFLDKGLDSLNVQELIEKLEPISDLLSSSWLDADALQQRVERILGVEGSWRLEGCTTFQDAVELYDDVNRSFMGWLHRRKSMDWCSAGYFSLQIRSYLYEALPREKKPRTLFPLQAPDIALMFQRLSDQYYFQNNTEYFGMLNAVYWFVEFLLDQHHLESEVVDSSQRVCREIFNLIIREAGNTDVAAGLWKAFPREF